MSTRESVVVSNRGQVTLPAGVRKRLGIEPGSVVILEERDGELVLRPAAVIEVEHYSDEQIRAWDADDRFAPGERERIAKRLAGGS